MEFKLFENEEFVCYSHKDGTAIHPALLAAADDDKKSEAGKPQPRLQALTMERELSFEYDDVGLGESDDEVGDDEQPKGTARRARGIKKSMVTIDPQAILMDAPEFEQTKKSTWDTGRSMRYNQDAQRQEDQRRMKEIRIYLTKLRLNPEKIDKPKKEFLGGQYCKIESQWRANNLQNAQKPTVGTYRGRPVVGGIRREKSHMY